MMRELSHAGSFVSADEFILKPCIVSPSKGSLCVVSFFDHLLLYLLVTLLFRKHVSIFLHRIDIYRGYVDPVDISKAANTSWESSYRVSRMGSMGTFMHDALEETARATANKILAVRSLMNEIGNEIRDRAPNLYSKDLVELLFYHAYAKDRFLEDAGIAKRHTVSAYLKKLQDIGIVSGVKIGRENYYINRRLINLLSSD